MNKVLVILSGGQDSTTCLFWAKKHFDEVHAITFNYGQRHLVEIEAARDIARMAHVASHEVLYLGKNILAGTSPLTNPDFEVEKYASADVLPGGLEKTFVPGRNILFLTIAANRAYCLGAKNMVTGVAQEDFGGYPDCRAMFIHKQEQALQAGLDFGLMVHTPLMHLTKAETVTMAQNLPGCMEALAYSHTCYDGQVPPCGKCHACLLRARGFKQAGVIDPLVARTQK